MRNALDTAAGNVDNGLLVPGTYTATGAWREARPYRRSRCYGERNHGYPCDRSERLALCQRGSHCKNAWLCILEKQSAAVDAVTGATLTSAAIRNAVSDCLVQAGANLSDWSTKETVRQGQDVNIDVLVVGRGTSGLTAALAAKTDAAAVKCR